MFKDNFVEPLVLTNHGIRLPEFKLADEDYSRYGISKNASNLEILTAICRAGFREKLDSGIIPKEKKREYEEKIRNELGVLDRTGFVDYILLVYLVQSYARKNNFAIGVGRGSAASSIVNYLSGITDLDPVKYGLIFERFISESRTKLNIVDGVAYISSGAADVDSDYGDDDRDSIVSYLKDIYNSRFVKLSTQGTLTTRILAKEIGKVLGYNEDNLMPLTGDIPVKFAKVASPEKAYEESVVYRQFCEKHPVLKTAAEILYHGINHTSSHASAYLVSHDELSEFMPCQLGGDGEIISTYEMNTANDLAIKLDILGVQTLSLVYGVLEKIGKKIGEIDYEDKKIYDIYLNNLEHSYGLFQISGDAVVRSLNKIKPSNFDELADVVSIARPGSFAFVDDYVDVKNNGISSAKCPEIFKDILEKTKYVAIFQEQLMFMANRIGFTMQEANDLRQVVSKKKTDKIIEWEKKIFDKGKENGVSKEDCKYLWDLALASADYSFCKCIYEECQVDHKSRGKIPLKRVKIGDEILCFDTIGKFDRFFKVKNILKSKKKCYSVKFSDGNELICSEDHKILVYNGHSERMKRLGDFSPIPGRERIVSRSGVVSAESIKFYGTVRTIDLEIDSADHNFYCENIVVSNSHAYSYSAIAGISVKLKFEHPKEFFLEALEMTQKKADPFSEIEQIQQELPYFGIQLLPPDLVKSDINFKIEGENIRFGLSAIKGVAEKAIPKLQTFLDKEKVNKFQFFFAAKEAGLNIAILSALIQAGCLHSLGDDRARMTLEAQIWSKLNEREREYCLAHGEKYGYDLIVALKDYLNWTDKKPFKESRLDTIRKQTQPYIEVYNKNKTHRRFANLMYEKLLLGFSFSETFKSVFSYEKDGLKNCLELKNEENGVFCCLVGRVVESKAGVSKKKNRYLKFVLSDETGQVNCIMSGDKFERYTFHSPIPKEDEIFLVEGKKGEGCLFVDRLSRQDMKIFLNAREIRKFSSESS